MIIGVILTATITHLIALPVYARAIANPLQVTAPVLKMRMRVMCYNYFYREMRKNIECTDSDHDGVCDKDDECPCNEKCSTRGPCGCCIVKDECGVCGGGGKNVITGCCGDKVNVGCGCGIERNPSSGCCPGEDCNDSTTSTSTPESTSTSTTTTTSTPLSTTTTTTTTTTSCIPDPACDPSIVEFFMSDINQDENNLGGQGPSTGMRGWFAFVFRVFLMWNIRRKESK